MKEEKERKKERTLEKAKSRKVIKTDFGISTSLIFHFIFAVITGVEIRVFNSGRVFSVFQGAQTAGNPLFS
jgi:hypothetical protein